MFSFLPLSTSLFESPVGSVAFSVITPTLDCLVGSVGELEGEVVGKAVGELVGGTVGACVSPSASVGLGVMHSVAYQTAQKDLTNPWICGWLQENPTAFPLVFPPKQNLHVVAALSGW